MAQLSDPRKLLEYKLGTALALERKAHTLLGTMEHKASAPELKQGFARHREETEQQIRNIERAADALGVEATGHRDAVMEGIAQHAEEMLGRTDEQFADLLLAGGAVDTELHEIATYQALITTASALDEDDVVALLQENLEQEQRTLKEVDAALQTLTRDLAQHAAA